MNELNAYQNFLQTFINEGIYLCNEPQPVQNYPKSSENSESHSSVNEPASDVKKEMIPAGKPGADIIFLLDQECDGWIKQENETRFLKLLQAIKKDKDSVALLNVSGCSKEDITKCLDEGNYKKIIALGTEEFLSESINVEHFSVHLSNDRQYLLTPSLDDIFADNNEGRKLWNALKQLFPEVK